MSEKRFFGFGEFGAWMRNQVQTLTDHLNLKLGEVNTRMDGVDQTLLNKANQSALDSTNQAVATKANQNEVSDVLDTKLDATAAAVDSAKLGGQLPAHYATQESVSTLNIKIDALKDVLDVTYALPVNEYVTVASSVTKQYDLQTLLGSTYDSFDLKTAEITVRAKDTNPTSPLYNAQANAEALISYGIKDERYVLVANQSTGSLEVYIKVLVHPKPL